MRPVSRRRVPISAPTDASSTQRKVSPAKSRPNSSAKSKSKLHRAHAFFYDDCAENFQGAGPKGKYPQIICARLTAPLSVSQLNQTVDVYQKQAAAAQSDPSTPVPFFFFDFDGTLSLADGLLEVTGGSLDRLFGNQERRRALQQALSTLLIAGQCYVITANGMPWRVAEALNALILSGGAGRGTDEAKFVLEDTVRYCPPGTKLKAIEGILAAKGFIAVRSQH